jgi:hypothetical protein
MNQEDLKSVLHYDQITGLFRWRFGSRGGLPWRQAGTLNGRKYVQVGINKKLHLAHRLAWLYTHGEWPSAEVDHVNGKTDDNRLCNLRIANRSQNSQNKRKPQSNNKSGFLGVIYWWRTKTWKAQICVNGKNTSLGYFKTPEQAHQAYLEAKRKLHSHCVI